MASKILVRRYAGMELFPVGHGFPVSALGYQGSASKLHALGADLVPT
jgi:hypothetical protein